MKTITALKMALLTINNNHGAGINGNWSLWETRRNIVAANFYQCMNDHGFNCGYVDFKVLIPKRNPDNWKVLCDGSYLARRYQVKMYLEDRLCDDLSNYYCTLAASRLNLRECYYFIRPTLKIQPI